MSVALSEAIIMMQNVPKESQDKCTCSSPERVCLTRRQASILTAGLVGISIAFFIGGYVIGQRKALHEFADRLADESFTDKIRYSLYSSYGNSTSGDGESDTEGENEQEKNVLAEQEEAEDTPSAVEEKAAQGTDELVEVATEPSSKYYYAQLVGFGTLKAAQKFVDKVQKRGFSVIIRERKSRTAKGNVISWYQVITERFTNKDSLLALVEKIQLAERLQQVKIVEE